MGGRERLAAAGADQRDRFPICVQGVLTEHGAYNETFRRTQALQKEFNGLFSGRHSRRSPDLLTELYQHSVGTLGMDEAHQLIVCSFFGFLIK